jgi:uncharacterized membrane protein YkgB
MHSMLDSRQETTSSSFIIIIIIIIMWVGDLPFRKWEKERSTTFTPLPKLSSLYTTT